MLPHMLRPGRVSSPTSLLLQTPILSWLLCIMIKRRPPKAKAPSLSLFFDGLHPAHQTSEPTTASTNLRARALCRPVGSCITKFWGGCCPTHGERAKPKDRVVAAAHFDCCVLCFVLCFIMCVQAIISYLTGRKSSFAKAKCVDPQIPGYGQTIPESRSCTCQHHLNVAWEPSRLS